MQRRCLFEHGATTTGLKYTFAVDVVVAAGAVTGQSATNTVNVHQDFGAGFQQIATDSDSVTLGLVVAKAVTASALPGHCQLSRIDPGRFEYRRQQSDGDRPPG